MLKFKSIYSMDNTNTWICIKANSWHQ
uniref:Uncharacterized protein n=1 Tax=Rhizophora mucronata TaxID=61149 RepID=A0A2P2QVR2_RHIMU